MTCVKYSGLGREGIDKDFLMDSLNYGLCGLADLNVLRDDLLGGGSLFRDELYRLRRNLDLVGEELLLAMGVSVDPDDQRVQEEQSTVDSNANRMLG